MERKKLIQLLVREGMSEKTLANFSDNQIKVLANRMISEVVQKQVTKTTYSPSEVSAAKLKGQGISVDKGNVTLNKDGGMTITQGESALEETLKGKQKNLDKNKNGKLDAQDFKMLRAKKNVTEKAPSAGLSKEKKSQVVKKAKAGKDIGKAGKGFKEIEKKAKESGAKNPKAVAAAAMWKNIPRESKLKESQNVKNWLTKLVESEYHPLTYKGEIMELIQTKLKQKTHISETSTTKPKPETKPTTKPGRPATKPGDKPKNPYQPGPGTNPKPKAGLSEFIDTKSEKMPDFMSFDSILSSGENFASPATKPKPETKPTTKPGRPATKPGDKPKNPYQPGPGTNPKPKARYNTEY